MLIQDSSKDSSSTSMLERTSFISSGLVAVAAYAEPHELGPGARRCVDLHADVEMAAEALDIWLARKTRRGYRIEV
jgi:hypothetical protein